MKLVIVAVGHRVPAWVDSGFEDYARRMPREAQFRLLRVKPEPRSDASSGARGRERLAQAEAARIAAVLPKGAFKVALDERGRLCTTRELAERLSAWQMDAREVAFMIGGADGLAAAVKDQSDFVWSLSPLTLPHALVRVVLAEQLYRAHTLLTNHPYHRE